MWELKHEAFAAEFVDEVSDLVTLEIQYVHRHVVVWCKVAEDGPVLQYIPVSGK